METVHHWIQPFIEEMNIHPLFSVGILLLIGYLVGKLASKVGLPEITGFIVAGLVLGESVTGMIPVHMSGPLQVVTEVALGLIALTIGSEFSFSKLRRLGKGIVIITLVQIGATFAAVTIALWMAGMQAPFAMLLGAIASATAPAATVAIVQSLRVRGVFIDYLYGVVALDDAGCVVLFGVIFAFASQMLGAGGEVIHTGEVIFHAVGEVLFSLLTGAIAGTIIHLLTRRRSSGNEIMIITLGMVFLATAISVVYGLSPLITNMTAGAVIINFSPRNHRIFRFLSPFSPPIYALFFVIAGTELRPDIILQGEILILGGLYIVFRAIGKYGGVWLGCLMSGAPGVIRNNLGFCMLPQAGVAIGLVLLIQTSPMLQTLPESQVTIVDTMVNIILFSVFVNELIGPVLSRHGVIRGVNMEV